METYDNRAELESRLKVWRQAIQFELEHLNLPDDPGYLSDPVRYALQAEGKRLRPALCFAAAEAIGADWKTALPAALAIEVFHTFTLVHDDIMDEDDLRRGQPTVHKAFDINRALIAGDAILIHAYQLLNQLDTGIISEALRMFNQAAMDVCQGQAWDMQFENSRDVLRSQYESMVDEKTGALIRLACGLGTLVGGGTSEQVAHLSKFGVLLGRAFQLQDDLLEMTSSADVMGKSLGSDVVNEKKTWLWLDIQDQMDPGELAEWQDLMAADNSIEAKLKGIRHWMEKKGTLDRARQQIADWISEGEKHLLDAGLSNITTLKALAELILHRKH